jgi:hypothetical protein
MYATEAEIRGVLLKKLLARVRAAEKQILIELDFAMNPDVISKNRSEATE